jgi:hypothetical protein
MFFADVIRNLNILTFQITFDARWTSMNVDPKLSIGWNNSRYDPSWRFYLDCGIKDAGIRCIIIQHVLHHPSDHGTSSVERHLLAKLHIAKSNELTQSEVSKLTKSIVNGTAFAILKRQGSRGISRVRSI